MPGRQLLCIGKLGEDCCREIQRLLPGYAMWQILRVLLRTGPRPEGFFRKLPGRSVTLKYPVLDLRKEVALLQDGPLSPNLTGEAFGVGEKPIS